MNFSPFLRSALCAVLLASTAEPCVAATPATDNEIAFAIKQRLLRDKSVPLSELDVQVTAGSVALTGTVDNLLAKERASRIAQSVRGAKIVLNDIAVKAPVRPDEELRRDIEAALKADPATDAYEIKTEVRDGAVTLSGIVESSAEKQLSFQVVRGVRGVARVTDKLEVEVDTVRRDSEIAAEIKRTLEMDVWLDARRVEVTVSEGKVRLSGEIGSAAEKARAAAQALVPAAREVDDSALKVEPALADNMRGPPRPNPTSAQLKETLQEAFRRHPRISAATIDINVHGSVVTLAGEVGNLKAKQAALRLVENTRGVSEVRGGDLRIPTKTPPPNATIEEEVRAAFARDPFLADDAINVSTGAGIVSLGGEVDSMFEKQHAEELVAGVKGVVTIANSLKAHDPAEVPFEENFAPYLDTIRRQLAPDSPAPQRSATTDEDLRRQVEQELRWSPFVDFWKVQVHVERGVVTLTGVTDSEHGYRAATANAREAGAVRVRNLIKIE